jgi:hypothetical protein
VQSNGIIGREKVVGEGSEGKNKEKMRRRE